MGNAASVNIAHIDSYKKYLSDERMASENTVISYIRDITRFADFLENQGKHCFVTAAADDVRMFLSRLEELDLSPATITRCIASLKAFYSHLLKIGVVARSPLTEVSVGVSEKKLPNILTTEQIERLFMQPDVTDPKGCRDKAMLETIYATGLRVSELIALDTDDVNLTTGLITCRSRNKERSIPLYTAAVRSIENYLDTARPKIASNDALALFVNSDGRRMSRQGFWKLLKSYSEKTMAGTDITPQTLRHSFAAHMLENGADIRSLQEMLGHANTSTTRLYSRVVKKQLKDVYAKSHPKAL